MYVEIGIDFGSGGYKAYTKEEFKQFVLRTASSLGINEVLPIVFVPDEGCLGRCTMRIIKINSTSSVVSPIFYFNSKLLDGKTYTINQINEAVKHELAHFVVYKKYKTDCGHDSRWQSIAKEFGCNGMNGVLSFGEGFYKINPTPVKCDSKMKYKYYLYCRKCGKLCLETDDSNAFPLFVISCMNLGIDLTMLDIDTKSACCGTDYKLIASAEDLLNDIDHGYDNEDISGWTKEEEPSLLETYNTLKNMLKK